MLNHLIDYARLHVPFSEPGFTVRDIRWRIELTTDGQLAGILPRGNEKAGVERWGCPEMHDMQSGGKAHFLIDNLRTALLLKAAAKDKARHDFFVSRLREAASVFPPLESVLRLLGNSDALTELRERLLLPPHRAKPTDNLEWCINGLDPLNDPAVLDWWRHWRLHEREDTLQGSEMVCFATGEVAAPALTHPKVMGLPGGQGSGDALIGFDKVAFTSLGLKKSANAAVSEQAARQYVDALNHLERHHGKRLGESKILHWFKGKVPDEDDVLGWLQDPPGVAAASASIAARKLFDAIHAGKRPDLSDNEFYVITVSGMSGRIMVRDWIDGPFEQLVRHIEAWFSDLAIIASDGKTNARDPRFYEICLALIRNDRSKSISANLEQLPAAAISKLWKVAAQGQPIPRSFMAQALARFRADIVADAPFNHARMGLIRTYFSRLNPGGNVLMTPYLNKDHPDPDYHC